MAALHSLEDESRAAMGPRPIHIDWAKVGGWAAASGLCLAVWAGVFLVFYYGWTA